MPSEVILDQLTPVLREVFDNNDLKATADLTANKVKDWDSLANVRLFDAIEPIFGIRFSAPEMSGLKNVGELADLIEKKVSRR